MDALKVILGDLPAADFFAGFWSARARVLPGPPQRFDDLFDWNEFVEILERNQASLVYPKIRVVRHGKILNPERRSRIPVARINELCTGGASIVFAGAQEHSPRLRRFASVLEDQLRCPVSVNAYYTPPGGAKAFQVHYDPYDVFILQILGCKTWKLYGSREVRPLMNESSDFRQPPEQAELEQILEKGQSFYIPRGCWHAAATSESSASLHLTVGAQSHTYFDLLSLVLERLKETELARRILPLGPGRSGSLSVDERETWAALDELLGQARELAPGALAELQSVLGPARDRLTLPLD